MILWTPLCRKKLFCLKEKLGERGGLNFFIFYSGIVVNKQNGKTIGCNGGFLWLDRSNQDVALAALLASIGDNFIVQSWPAKPSPVNVPFVSYPPNIPKQIEGSFRWWWWLMTDTPGDRDNDSFRRVMSCTSAGMEEVKALLWKENGKRAMCRTPPLLCSLFGSHWWG